MLINLRNALMAGKRWTNPYVTDGLVAMWDGEWNAGGGKHNDTTTVIKDLIGSCDLSIVDTTTIGGNYFMPAFLPNVVNLLSSVPLPTTIRAIEMTVTDAKGGANNFGIMTIAQNYRGVCKFVEWIGCGSSGNYLMRQQSVNSGIAVWSINYNNDNNNTNVSFCKNGEAASGATTSWSSVAMADGTDSDKLVRVRAPYADCRIYSIRLYNRTLAASEIAANYAIDKARFGLPDAT